MTQENLPSNDDRSRPRYQAPTTGGPGSRAAGPNSQPSASAYGPAQKQTTPDPFRPTDWPAPAQAYPAPGPSFGAYPPPPAPGTYDWTTAAAEAKSGNLYHYENYNGAAFQPPQPLDPQAEAYRQASRRVRARLDFQKHLWSYLLVNGFLWIIYFMTMNPAHQTFWPIWSTVFWGIGVAAQWWQLSGREDDRRRRMVEEEMRRRNHY
jgi:hypothetical protein